MALHAFDVCGDSCVCGFCPTSQGILSTVVPEQAAGLAKCAGDVALPVHSSTHAVCRCSHNTSGGQTA
jgi:hypothetical protein